MVEGFTLLAHTLQDVIAESGGNTEGLKVTIGFKTPEQKNIFINTVKKELFYRQDYPAYYYDGREIFRFLDHEDVNIHGVTFHFEVR